jgi:hypothetical protein
VKNVTSKSELFSNLQSLCQEIETLFEKDGLATLDHKLKTRQELLETLLSEYGSDLTQKETDLLRHIHEQVTVDIQRMSVSLKEKEKEILERKRSGKRMNIYTDIARQK